MHPADAARRQRVRVRVRVHGKGKIAPRKRDCQPLIRAPAQGFSDRRHNTMLAVGRVSVAMLRQFVFDGLPRPFATRIQRRQFLASVVVNGVSRPRLQAFAFFGGHFRLPHLSRFGFAASSARFAKHSSQRSRLARDHAKRLTPASRAGDGIAALSTSAVFASRQLGLAQFCSVLRLGARSSTRLLRYAAAWRVESTV